MRNAVVAELVDPKRTVQIGIRGFAEVLWEFSYQSGMQVIHIDEFYDMGWKKVVSDLRKKMGDGPFYISFDIDCLDPAFALGRNLSSGRNDYLRSLTGIERIERIEHNRRGHCRRPTIQTESPPWLEPQ